jgi:hypothetical protein
VEAMVKMADSNADGVVDFKGKNGTKIIEYAMELGLK